MTANLTLALLIGLLYAVGTYLLLQRTLTRIVIGIGLLGHGANLLLLQAGGPAGGVPFIGPTGGGAAGVTTADPLPQAMVLTGDDEAQDDVEDARIARTAPEGSPALQLEDDL